MGALLARYEVGSQADHRAVNGEDELRLRRSITSLMSEVPAVNLEGAVPSHLPVLPLKSTVVFPRIFIPLSVGRKRSLQLLDELTGSERHIAVATQLDE